MSAWEFLCFLKQKDGLGESCEERNYKSVKEFGEWCLENEWSKETENLCILFGQLPGIGGGVSYGDFLFSEDHEECRWNYKTIYEEVTQEVLSEAFKFIENPGEG